MSKSADAVKRWRKNTKQRMIDAFGGKCGICDYDRLHDALDFHQLVSEEKEFGLGDVMSCPIAWSKIVKEIKKCILVCNRCHKEIHAGITRIPKSIARFNNDYTEYRAAKKEPCPICGEPKEMHLITCSKECAGKKRGKVDWDDVDLDKLLIDKSIMKIAEGLGVSDMAVRKRMKKLGIKKPVKH